MPDISISVIGQDKASAVFSGIADSARTSFKVVGTAIAAGMAAAGAAIVGTGALALNLASDIDTASSRMVGSLALSEDQAGEFEDTMKGIFANNFGENFDDIAQSIVSVEQAFARIGGADEDLQQITEAAIALRDAFDVGINESADAAVALIDRFGVTGEQAMDIIAAGFQYGLNSSDDFLDSIREYAGVFDDAGFSAEQMLSILASGQQAGVLGTDKIADAVKEMTVRLTEGGEEVNRAFETAGLNFEEIQGFVASGDETWADYFSTITRGLRTIEDPIARQQAQIAIFGTMAEDLGPTFTTALDSMLFGLEDVEGATDRLMQQYDNWPSMWEGIKRTALLGLEPISEALLGIGNRVMPQVQSAVQSGAQILADSFTTLQQALAGEWTDDPDAILPIHRIFGNLGTAISEFQRGFDSGAGEGLLKRIFLGTMEAADDFLPQDVLTRIYDLRDGIASFKNLLGEGDIAGALSMIMPPEWAALVASGAEALGNFNDKLTLARFLIGEGEWVTALSLFIPQEWATRVGEAATKLGELATKVGNFIRENPQQLVSWATDLGLAFAGWYILQGLIPLIAGAATVVLGFITPVGALTLGVIALGLAWKNNWGDIQSKVEEVWEIVSPIFKEFIDDLEKGIPEGVDASSVAFKTFEWGDFITDLIAVVELGNQLADIFNYIGGGGLAADVKAGVGAVKDAVTGTKSTPADPNYNVPISPTPPPSGGGGGAGNVGAQSSAAPVNIVIQDSRTPEETAYKVMDIIQGGAF